MAPDSCFLLSEPLGWLQQPAVSLSPLNFHFQAAAIRVPHEVRGSLCMLENRPLEGHSLLLTYPHLLPVLSSPLFF